MNTAKLGNMNGVQLVEDGHDPVEILVWMAEAGASFDEFLLYGQAVIRHHPEAYGESLRSVGVRVSQFFMVCFGK